MKTSKSAALAVCLVFIFLSPQKGLRAADWPQYRGPNNDGKSSATEVFPKRQFGLEVTWRRPLGDGYSSIVATGGLAVTMFSEDDSDFLNAMDAATGAEIWRHRMGPRYEGHTGSDSGPSSTPTISEGMVYALGRSGSLVAVHLKNGDVLWAVDLEKAASAKTPHYGFTTSPVVSGELVIVQTGGTDGHSVSAFSQTDGSLRWSAGDGAVSYQSPTLLKLGDQAQLVAINDEQIMGMDPKTGNIIWRHAHNTLTVEAFAQPLLLRDNQLLINSLDEVVALQVVQDKSGFSVTEAWRSAAFKSSYAVPVVHQGYLYGFSREFLTCVDATNGAVQWKSRPPGGRGLILVDGHLVVLDANGHVVVIEASPEGYKERARVKSLQRYSMAPPSFADGHIFVRNLAEAASVAIVAKSPREMRADPILSQSRGLLGDFGKFVQAVEISEHGDEMVTDFLADHDELPLLEGDDLVHFLYKSAAEEVALSGSFLGSDESVVMDRISGTDLHFKSYRLDPEMNWTYQFTVDLETDLADPQNPLKLSASTSELRMPQWTKTLHISQVDGPSGRLDSFEFRSDFLKNTRRIRVYLPPTYSSQSDVSYPLLVTNSGGAIFDQAQLQTTLDNLSDKTLSPVIVVAFGPQSLEERGGSVADNYVRMLTEELIPHIDKHYRTRQNPASRAIMGSFSGGTMALYAAFKAPHVFGKAVSQSAYTELQIADELMELIERGDPKAVEVYVDWSRHDLVLEEGNIDCAEESKELFDALQANRFSVSGGEQSNTWGWAGWRAQYEEILGGLFPLESTD